MNIETHLTNNYDAGIQNRVKAEQGKETGKTNDVRPLADIANLKEGAVFKGEILDIAGDKVTIELETQAKLLARLQEGVELGVGDRLLFSVKENQNNQILIKPMFDSLLSAQTQTLEKVLDAAGLSPTERNFTAAKELMDAGMPIDKASIVRILSQSMKFEGTSMQTLVALNKMNIPVTEGNIAQYERYQNYSHQLTGDIAAAADSIADFASAMPEDTSAEKMLALTGEILEIFSAGGEEKADMVENGQEQPVPAQLQEAKPSDDTVKAADHPLPGGELISETGKESIDAQKSMQTAGNTEAADTIKQEETVKETSVERDTSAGKETSVERDTSAGKETSTSMAASTGGEVSIKQETESAVHHNPVEKFGLDRESLQNLSRTLQKAGVLPEQARAMFQNAESPADLLKQITKTLMQNSADMPAVHAVVTSNEFKKMLSDLVKNNWSMDPKSMKDPKEIDELYEKIAKQSKAFEDTLSAKGGNSGQFQQNSQSMRQNMNFMEQINNQMIYAQMPLKLSNQNANSELYVYADKRKLAQKKDGISVMLHLDMDHLGMTDIKVTLTGSNVNARFYLNDQQSVDLVAENMEQLAEQLKSRGFSLTNEVIKRQPQESINKVVDEIIDENAERSIKRYTFDVKM
ncbi:MAG: flagellar hook-length control protein FliK [Clostridium sp.]|nr:flagellar hook-length control protein FliK [Clostridium sp.]